QPPAEKPGPPSSTARVPWGQDLSSTRLGSPGKAVEKRGLPCAHPKGEQAGGEIEEGASGQADAQERQLQGKFEKRE
ncbi:hypothetical protein D4Z76_09425, partial [Campylobacter coli]